MNRIWVKVAWWAALLLLLVGGWFWVQASGPEPQPGPPPPGSPPPALTPASPAPPAPAPEPDLQEKKAQIKSQEDQEIGAKVTRDRGGATPIQQKPGQQNKQ